MLPDPALDLLRRVPPRGPIVPVQGDDTVSAVVATLLGLDRSYLAIQGPPGTGKTYVGSNVVARLVREYGWRVGHIGEMADQAMTDLAIGARNKRDFFSHRRFCSCP